MTPFVPGIVIWAWTGVGLFSDLSTLHALHRLHPLHCLQIADTADQDADKSRTYDHARLEYSHLDVILYIGRLECVRVGRIGQGGVCQGRKGG